MIGSFLATTHRINGELELCEILFQPIRIVRHRAFRPGDCENFPDDHVLTNLAMIEKHLPVKSTIEEMDRGLRNVSIVPA